MKKSDHHRATDDLFDVQIGKMGIDEIGGARTDHQRLMEGGLMNGPHAVIIQICNVDVGNCSNNSYMCKVNSLNMLTTVFTALLWSQSFYFSKGKTSIVWKYFLLGFAVRQLRKILKCVFKIFSATSEIFNISALQDLNYSINWPCKVSDIRYISLARSEIFNISALQGLRYSIYRSCKV